MAQDNSITDIQASDGLKEKLVGVYRHAKVVKGGRRFSFKAVVVVGGPHREHANCIGIGCGSSRELADAIKKALEAGRRNMMPITLNGSTLYHAATIKYGASKVFMMPASPGTGVIAGGASRAVFEVAGVKDVLSKIVGSRNALNVVKATIKGLVDMFNPESVTNRRGISINWEKIDEA